MKRNRGSPEILFILKNILIQSNRLLYFSDFLFDLAQSRSDTEFLTGQFGLIRRLFFNEL